MIAALARKVRTGQVAPQEAASAGGSFRQDWRDQYQIVEVSTDVADRAMELAEKHGLRGYDAVHLGAAVAVQAQRQARRAPPLTFISADV